MSLGRGYKEYEKCEHRVKNKRFNIFEISTATIHCLSIHIDKNEENCYIQKEIRKKIVCISRGKGCSLCRVPVFDKNYHIYFKTL